MPNLANSFWKHKKVFITGHTGFKGSWLSIWLNHLGADVTGYALEPPTQPSLFELSNIANNINSIFGDISDCDTLRDSLQRSKAEIIIHMAAQSLVRESYRHPIETYNVNVLGTAHVLEAVRSCPTAKVLLNVTTDKCYQNREWVWGYRENDRLGGNDPYSSSKACSELVTSSYRQSFFAPEDYDKHGVAIATARAGNVIGGGDWAEDRLIPDCIRAFIAGDAVVIRNPRSIRPWQHVLEPLSGYLLLSQFLYEKGIHYSGAWNFGPDDRGAKSAESIVKTLCKKWGDGAAYSTSDKIGPDEAQFLKLDCQKARTLLDWHPRWSVEKALDRIISWTKAYVDKKDLKKICIDQITEYTSENVQS